MPAPEPRRSRRPVRARRQAGATVVEFALLALLFFAFLFAVIDLARLMFLYNTLQEATRRAANMAAVADPSNAATMNQLRRQAIFRQSAGGLILMPELTDTAIRIDYLSVSRDASGAYAMQTSSAASFNAAENRHQCLVDPYGASCVRLIRARVCDPQTTATCQAMKFKPTITFFNVQVPLPLATAMVRAQSFGYRPP